MDKGQKGRNRARLILEHALKFKLGFMAEERLYDKFYQ